MPAEIQVNVNLNDQKARNSLADLVRYYKQAEQQMNRPFKSGIGDQIGQIDKAAAKSARAIKEYCASINEMQGAEVRAAGAVTNSQGTFQRYTATVQGTQNTMQKYSLSVNTATGEVYALDKGIKSATTSASSMGKAFANTLKQVVGWTGVAQSLRYALREMKDMSDELAAYRKVTGATAADMEKIRAAAYDSAKKYGQSPSDFLASASNMARAGYRENAVAMADLATKTQLVGDMTADTASKFLLAVDAGYKYQGNVKQLMRVLDSANAVDNNFATSLEKISDGLTLISSLGGQANVPIEELIAGIGTITAATQRSGHESARALRSIFLNVLKDTSTEIEEGVRVTEENVQSMTDALILYGDEATKAAAKAGKLINPMKAIGALAKAYKEGLFTETELFAMSKNIAGQRYYNAFAALIENYDGMYEHMLQTAQNAAGSADAEIATLMESWSHRFETFKTTFVQLVNESITEGFIGDLIDGGTAALEFAGSLENLALMAVGAKEAISSLGAGIKNLRAPGAKLSDFGGLNLATSIIGLGVVGIGAWKAAYENNIRQVQKAAQEAIEKATASSTKYTTLTQLSARYEEIAGDGIQTEQGELEALKTLQSELNGLVGDQAGAIDLVNGKYADQKKALADLTRQQKEILLEEWTNARTKAINDWNTEDFNGFYTFGGQDGYSYTNVPLEQLRFNNEFNKAVREMIDSSQYLRILEAGSMDQWGLGFKKPSSDPEAMIQAYHELKTLYEYFGTHTLTNDAVTASTEAAGTAYRALYTALGNLLAEVEPAAQKVEQAHNEMERLNADLADMGNAGGSASGAADAVEDVASSVYTLTDALNEATGAKTAFDTAMEASKADVFNTYTDAVKALKEELDAGRVNSTRFYAAARFVMGQDAYNATGGTYESVMDALNMGGNAGGTLMEGLNILTEKYVDALGREMEGFGLWHLADRSGLWKPEQLRDKNGNYYLPEFTTTDYENLSSAWGGIPISFLRGAFEALDQHDIHGGATDENVKPQTADEQEAQQETEEFTEQITTATTATEAFTEAITAATDALTQEPPETGSNQLAAAQNPDVWQMPPIDLTINTDKAEKAVEELQEETGKVAAKQFSDYDNSIEKMQALKAELEATGFQFEEALTNLGATWEEVKAAFLDYQRFTVGEPTVTPEMDDTQIRDALDLFMQDWTGHEIVFGLRANPDAAIKTADDTVRKINQKTANIKVGATYTGGIIGGLVSGFLNGLRLANGTEDHPGGPAIVNDGTGTNAGPELIVNKGRAFIAGGGEPSLVSLEKGAKVFTASETRAILNRSGIPAYAAGTEGITLGGGTSMTQAEYDASKQAGTGEKPTTSTSGGTSKTTEKEKEKDESYDKLTEAVDYIINRINEALEEQVEIIDKQISELRLQREQAKQQDELEDKQKAVTDAQNDLTTALSERTIRYLGEDGRWHWMADARNVKEAQEALDEAREELADYQDEMAFDEQIKALEAQKTALQDEFKKVSDTWEKIQAGVATPTDSVTALIQAVLAGGSPQEQTGAKAVRDYLIGTLLTGGRYSGNYSEAINSMELAAAGTPIMPGENRPSLASLIAMGGNMSGDITSTLRTAEQSISNGLTTNNYTINNNGNSYTINGITIPAEQADTQPLSQLISGLAVYSGY